MCLRNPFINLVGITKHYPKNDKPIFENLNLTLYDDQFIALSGESGCGKSTLLRILGLIDIAFEGNFYFKDLRINQKDVLAVESFRKNHLGIVFQDHNLIERYTIYRNLELPLIVQKVPFHKRRDMIEKALRAVNLSTALLSRYPYELSGGQNQRIAICRALIKNPTLILADEPTGNLDDHNAEIVLDVLKSLKIPIILTTHDLEIARQADRHIHFTKAGEIIDC